MKLFLALTLLISSTLTYFPSNNTSYNRLNSFTNVDVAVNPLFAKYPAAVVPVDVLSADALKIKSLEATVAELRQVKNDLLAQLSTCQQKLNFSQMTIQNTGNNPCFKQDVNMG